MPSQTLHSLLKRQLKKAFGDAFVIPDAWSGFIDLVNDAYHEADTDRNMLERSLDLSSQELLQTNSEMRAIFEAVPDLFFRVDASGRILDCKAGSQTPDLFISRSNMIGRRIDDIPVASAARIFSKAIEKVRQNRAPLSIEYSLKRRSVESFFEARWIPVEENQTIVVIRNITDRQEAQTALRKSEEYYRELTMNSSDMLFIIDERGRIAYASPSAERITGYSPQELIGKNSLFLIAPEDHARAIEDFQRALATTEASVPNHFRIRRKNGSIIIMEGVGRNLLHHPVIAGFVMTVRDVTGREKAQAALERSEQKYRQLAELAHDLILTVDLDFKITYINRAVADFSGGIDVIGASLLDFTPAHLHSLQWEIMQKRREGFDETLAFEWEIFAPVGDKRIFDIRSTLITENGKPSGVLFIARDATQRREAEEALRESEKKYKLLTEKMTDVVWIADMNLQTVYVTPSVKNLLGFSQEERMQQSVEEQFTPESLARGMDAFTHELAAEQEGATDLNRKATLVLEYYHKDGSTRWMETTMSGLRNEQGNLIGLHGVSRDITEQKKAQDALRTSEERYRTIFEHTATANMIVAEDTTILMANDHFAELSGYTKEEIEGKLSWTVFVHHDDLERMKDYHQQRRLDDGSAPSSYEFRFMNRRGELKTLFISVAVIPETKESIISLVDLTERKQLETQLIQAQKMESVGRLAGGVAHDFNNMLSVIIGNTEMAMKRMKSSESLYKTLQDVLSAGLRSADLTRQLLAFARKQTISPRVLDLNDTLTGMLKMLQRLIGENIELSWRPGHNLWKVKIDPSQVDQLLANLAVNARDAIETSGRITIETSNITCDASYCAEHPECVPGDYVVLALGDSGCGMDRETLANIFEPFFTTKKEGQGTGLGLATVYGIVRQNNGFIDVLSEPQKGTIFRIYLPRTDDDQDTDAEAEEPQLPGGNETVLIVEDEKTVLKLSKAMLEALGYVVLAAGNKDDALDLANHYPGGIDLLLTDIVMPDMNGRELSERILSIRPQMKCLFMSGYTADVIARQGILEAGVHFISKPFSLRDLAAKVRETMDD